MEPFKNLVNPGSIARIGAMLATTGPFDLEGFVAESARDLDPLELKARVRHVATVLRRHLPADWPSAMRQVVAALPPAPVADDALSAGLFLWPLAQLVEDHGLEFPALSLCAMRAITPHASAEFAVRPYLVRHPAAAWAAVDEWSRDSNMHVRRLASEGTRPRLPWGQRLHASIADPSRGLRVIDRLVDDPSAYVRRSVANHLGDVAKDHPRLAVDVARGWLPGRRRLVEHALRDLLKKGDGGALALLGQGGAVAVEAVRVEPSAAAVGGRVRVLARLSGEGTVRADVVWQWPGARGWSAKTFRGAVRELAAGEAWSFETTLDLRPVTTRPVRLGEQRVFLRVNGADHGPVSFVLLDAGPSRE